MDTSLLEVSHIALIEVSHITLIALKKDTYDTRISSLQISTNHFLFHCTPLFQILDFCGSQWKAKLSGERAPSVLMKGGEERQRKVRTGFWQQIQALKGDRRVLERQRRKTSLS